MDASKFNRGIQLMYHNDTKQVGLSYAAGSVILKAPFSFIPQGYFGNGADRKLEMPAIADGEIYFLPFDAVLNQSKTPLLAVQPRTLTKCETIESSDVSALQQHQSPLPAFVNDRGYGLIYTSDKSFLEHFENAPVYLSVDYTYQPEKKHVSKDHVIFLSMRSILLSALMCDDAAWDPVEVVPLKAVAAYLPALLSDGSALASKPAPLSSQVPRSLSKVTFHHSSAAQEHRTPAAVAPTAVVVRKAGTEDSKSTYAEGLTTGGLSTGTNSELGLDAQGLPYNAGSGRRALTSSRLHIAPDTANSPASDSEHDHQEAHQSPMSSLASSPVASRGAKKMVIPAASVVGAVCKLRPRVPGPSDVWKDVGDTRRVKLTKSEQAEEAQRVAACRAFMADVWPHTLEQKGWTKVWSRNHQGDNHLSFLTPGWSSLVRTFPFLKDCRFIENLEVFHSYEALCEHVSQNPCLEEGWLKLWERLRSIGWHRVEGKGKETGNTLFFYLSFAQQYRTHGTPVAKGKAARDHPKSLDDCRSKGIVPGQHVFVSRGALMKYIARFPYLLQDDLALVDTLQRLNWRLECDSNSNYVVQWALSAEDRSGAGAWKFKGTSSTASFAWVSLAELRRRLWLVPERLFQHTVPSIPAVVVLQALRLTEAEGEALDEDLLSPQVKNMTRDERDMSCQKLETLLDKYLEKCSSPRPKIDEKFEDSVRTALRRVGWVDQKCVWSLEWWKEEIAWCAPWVDEMVREEKEPVLGRDFFWTLLAVAQYAADQACPAGAVNDFFYTPLLQAPPRFVPTPASIRATEREHANNLVLKLVRNHQNPFEAGPLKDMLVSTGWKVFGDDAADVVVFVPHWRAKEVHIDNYSMYVADVDYFDTLGGVQSHLEDYGNKPAPIAPVHTTSNTITTYNNTSASTTSTSNTTNTANAANTTKAAYRAQTLSLPTPEEYILHLGKRHLVHSVEGAVVQELEGDRYFVKIFNLLKHIGWNTAWIGNERGFIIAPWGFTRTVAFDERLKKIKNLSLLRENIDYFEYNDGGKAATIDYLLKRGFEERIIDYDPFSVIGSGSNSTGSDSSGSGAVKPKTARTKAAKAPPKVQQGSDSEMEVENEAENEPCSAQSSPSGSESSTLTHLGKTYDTTSMQAQVVIELEGDCYFARMFPLLKVLGWGTSWVGQDLSYIITPWGYDNEAAFADAKKKKIKDLSLLRENLDYFVFSDEGKRAMFAYLRKRGFRERLVDYDPIYDDNTPRKVEDSPASISSSGSSASGDSGSGSNGDSSSRAGASEGPVFTAEGVSFTGNFYDAESKEYRLIRQLFHATPHFGQIYTSLKCDFLWGSHYVLGLNATMIFAAWALEVEGAFTVDGRMRYKLDDLSVLEEGVDYFRDDAAGKAAMIAYLKTHGIEGPSGRVPSPPREVESHSPETKQHKYVPVVGEPEHIEEEEEEEGESEGEQEHEVEEEEEEVVIMETSQPHHQDQQQQRQRKRKADSSPPRAAQQHYQQAHHTHAQAQAHTQGEDGRRSRRGGALDPATEVCPAFKADYEQLRVQMKKGKFALSTRAAAPLEMWLALKTINRSWRCNDDLQGRTWYFRTVGCNEHTVNKFTEGVDYFRSLGAFWVFVTQQYALHFDSHSLVSEEEKRGGVEVPRAAGPRSRASSIASSRGTLSQQSSKSGRAESKVQNKGENKVEKVTQPSPAVDLRKFDSLTIRKRSPSKACYRAFDPSSNLDRLVAGVSSPDSTNQDEEVEVGGEGEGEGAEDGSSDEDSYFQRRRLAAAAPSPSFARAAYDVDMQEVFGDILKDSPQPDGLGVGAGKTGMTGHDSGGDFDNDTDYIPLTQHMSSGGNGGDVSNDASDGDSDGSGGEEGEASIVDMLSAARPPFQRILHQLQWTYAYVNANTAMPNGEPSAGLTHVYLRPGRGLHSAGMVKGEDYFLTEESLIDYLRVQYGLQALPQYVSNTKKPRATRSGRVIDGATAAGTDAAHTLSNRDPNPSNPNPNPNSNPNTWSTMSSAVPRSAHSSPVATASASSTARVPIPVPGKAAVSVANPAGEKRGRVSAVEEEKEKEGNKRLKSTASPPASPSGSGNGSGGSGASTPPQVPGLIPKVSSVIRALKSASKQSTYSAGLLKNSSGGSGTSGSGDFASPLGRELEYCQLLSLVANALLQGRGGAAYVCGSPGMGKTHMIVSVLDAIAQDRRNSISAASKAHKDKDNGKSGSPDSKKVRAADVDLGYNVVWLSGAGMKSKNDVFAPIAEQLNLKPTTYSSLNRGNSKSGRSDAEQMVIERFSAPGVAVELGELSRIDLISSSEMDVDNVDGTVDTTTAATTSTAHSPVTARNKALTNTTSTTNTTYPDSAQKGRPRSRAVPMTVVVIDEMDMAHKDAVAQLCLLATCAPSSLVIIGMGNVVNHITHLNVSGGGGSVQVQKVQQFVLEPYTKGHLTAILKSLTGGLFKEAAITFLAQKVEQNNKGDMRALLRYADLALTKAASTLQACAATPSSEVVTVKHIMDAYGSSKDPSVSLLESFSPLTVRLLVAMLKFETENPSAGLTQHNILVAYSNYLELKKLPTEDEKTARGRLGDLVGYNFVRVVKNNRHSPDQSLYAILVSVDVMLQANLGEGMVKEELLLIKNNRMRREAEASLTQY